MLVWSPTMVLEVRKVIKNVRRMLSMVYFYCKTIRNAQISSHILRKAAAKSVILGRKNQKKVPQNPGGTDQDTWCTTSERYMCTCIQYIRTFIYLQKEVVEQVTVRLFVSSMELFKCYMQNKQSIPVTTETALQRREQDRERWKWRQRERKEGWM